MGKVEHPKPTFIISIVQNSIYAVSSHSIIYFHDKKLQRARANVEEKSNSWKVRIMQNGTDRNDISGRNGPILLILWAI